MQLNMSYGKTITFWKNSRINFNISQINVNTQPILDVDYQRYLLMDKRQRIKEKNKNSTSNLFRIGHSMVQTEIGIGINHSIRKKINNHFRWESFGRIFANALNPGSINFNYKNSFIVNPIKHLTVMFSMYHVYRPLKWPYQVQQKYELMAGFEF